MTAKPPRSGAMPAAGRSLTTAAENIVPTQGRLDRSPRGAGLGTWWWDITNNTLAWDEAMYRLFGVSSDAAVFDYEGFIGYVHEDDRAGVNALVERALAAAEDYAATFRVV